MNNADRSFIMGRAWVVRGRRMLVASVLCGALVVGMTGNAFGLAPPAGEDDRTDAPAVDPVASTPVKPVRGRGGKPVGVPRGPAPAAAWPTTGRATVDLAGVADGTLRRAQGLPVSVGRPDDPPAGRAGRAPVAADRVSVEMLDRAAADEVGASGPVMRLDAAAGGTARVRLDLSAFADSYGGAWASRLRLVAYPACVLDRPEDPECDRPVPLETTRAGDGRALVADVELADPATDTTDSTDDEGDAGDSTAVPGPPDATDGSTDDPTDKSTDTSSDQAGEGDETGEEPSGPDATVPGPSATGSSWESSWDWSAGADVFSTASFQPALTVSPPAAEESGVVVAATAEASGPKGDWTATSLKSAASWSAGGSTGSFSWSYGFRTPQAASGLGPELGLGYDSGAVDGQTSAENNQPGPVGVGWSLGGAGFIERSYTTCGTDADKAGSNNSGRKTGDLCWDGEPLSLSLGSHAGELIPVDSSTPGDFRLRNDDETRVERIGVKGGPGEHFKVTTADGTQYWFGRERATTGAAATNSAWRVPVFGNHAGEPGHASTFGSSWKQVTWRWNLSYVVDPAGNSMTYHWEKETNKYGRNRDQAVSTYDRGGWLSRIDYGTRTGQEDTATAPARVLFDTEERCLPSAAPCEPGDLTAASAQDWPDVPFDQICTSSTSCGIERSAPTFFTRKRLAAVTTQVATGADAWRKADRWELTHAFPAPADGDRVLWLDSIAQDGMGAAIDFGGAPMDNRVDGVDNATALMRYRVTGIVDEFGKRLTVNYTDPDVGAHAADHCGPSDVPADPANNTRLCFPVKYTPPGNYEPDADPHWFHKYLVTAVTQTDDTGATKAGLVTGYLYRGAPAWAKSDNPRIPVNRRTWDQWRGYGKVEVRKGDQTDPQSSVVTRYFRGMNGDPNGSGGSKQVSVTDSTGTTRTDHRWLAGRVRETETFNGPGGQRLSSTITDYQDVLTSSKTGPRAPRRVVIAATHGRSPAAGGATHRKDVVSTYDDHGRPVSRDDRAYRVAGDGTQTQTDRLCTTTTYATNTNAWMLTYPKSSKTVSVGCQVSDPAAGKTVTAERYGYDGQPVGTAPTKGRVTRTEVLDHHDAGGGEIYVPTKRTTHDQWGRATEVLDAKDRATTISYEQTVPGAVATTTTTTSPDPDGSGDLVPHTTTTEIDDRWGVPTLVTDPSGALTRASYDGLGRLQKVWLPGREVADVPNLAYDYHIAGATGATMNAVTTDTLVGEDDTVRSVEIFDAFLRDRQVQTETRHTDPATGEIGPGRTLVSTGYDSAGRRTHVDSRVFDGTSGPTTTLVKLVEEAPETTAYTYDGAGRVLTETTDWVGEAPAVTTMVYDGNITHTTPPEGGVATSTVVDPRGRTSELWQHPDGTPTTAGGGHQATRYDHDPAGQLTKITDPAGNAWTYGYDLRGRRVSSADPDAGQTSQTYDVLGQLTSTTDASGDTLAYTYDRLGRKTSLREDTATGQLRATWTHDTLAVGLPASASRYHDGQVAYTQAVTGYDDANRPTGTRATLYETPGLIPAELARSYATEQTWRPDGTPAVTDHHDTGVLPAERLEHDYDDLGRPTQLVGSLGAYALDTKWSVHDQLDQLALGNTYGNLSWQSFKYQSGSGRLEQIQIDRQTRSFFDERTTYAHDPAGNITRLDVEAWHEDAESAGAVPVETQCFSYDNLAQLTQAWTPGDGDCTADRATSNLGGPAPYWATYDYDNPTGNRTGLTWRTPAATTRADYSYNGPQPHTLTAVATTLAAGTTPDAQVEATAGSYAYSPDGHTTTRPGPNDTDQSLTWDPEGKLTTVATASGDVTQRALYGPDGNRIIRVADDTTTAYLPGGLEVQHHTDPATGTTELTGRRYYQHAGQTIAVRTGDNPGQVTTLFADHQGSANYAIANGDSTLTVRRQRPFGGPRGQDPASWPGDRGFVGGTRDQAAGLIHIGARPYDPGTGRFTTIDPLLDAGDPQQTNGYTYANNNPTTQSDPTGLIPVLPGGEYDNEGHNNPFVNGGGTGLTPPGLQPPGSPNATAGPGPLPTVHDGSDQPAPPACPFPNRYRCVNPNSDGPSASGVGHFLLDVGGAFPIFGAVPDVINCGWYGAEGDTVNAGLSCGSAPPVVGYGATVLKFGKTLKLTDEAADAAKTRKVDDVDNLPCNCFVAGTKVQTIDGEKPIEEIQVGEQVWAKNLATGSSELRTVSALFQKHADSVMTITVAGGAEVTVTDEHPFYVTGEGWVMSGDLHVGDQLDQRDGASTKITSIEVAPADTTVYNFTVDGDHNYYVSDAQLLVHNCAMPKASSPVWKGLKTWRGGTRTNGLSGKKRRYYEWDHTHGDIEVYNSRGVHLGTMDPEAGEMIKDAVTGRTINVH